MAIPIAKSMGLNVITNDSAQNQERVMRLGADRFIDYKSEDYSKALYDVDYVLDTLGVREPEKEFSILKSGGSLVSLRGLPNGEFAARMGMPTMKRFLFRLAGNKFDRMAAKNKQKYYFVFFREGSAGLERISEIFGNRKIETSVDKIFELSEVNIALAKVAEGGSKGKTILKIS